MLAAYTIAGEDSLLLKIVAEIPLGVHLRLRRIRTLGPHVTTRTMMILNTYFEKTGPSPFIGGRSSRIAHAAQEHRPHPHRRAEGVGRPLLGPAEQPRGRGQPWPPWSGPSAPSGLQVVHVRHRFPGPQLPPAPRASPATPSSPRPRPCPGRPCSTRAGHCAFVGTGLEAHLRERGIDRLVLAGFTTSHCVSTTARPACDLGFKTVVLRDACVAFDLEDVDGNRMPAQVLHDAGLAELHGEFAMVLPTEAILQLL